jgi:hypothetical protein
MTEEIFDYSNTSASIPAVIHNQGVMTPVKRTVKLLSFHGKKIKLHPGMRVRTEKGDAIIEFIESYSDNIFLHFGEYPEGVDPYLDYFDNPPSITYKAWVYITEIIKVFIEEEVIE